MVYFKKNPILTSATALGTLQPVNISISDIVIPTDRIELICSRTINFTGRSGRCHPWNGHRRGWWGASRARRNIRCQEVVVIFKDNVLWTFLVSQTILVTAPVETTLKSFDKLNNTFFGIKELFDCVLIFYAVII